MVLATFNSAKEIYDVAGKIKEEGYQNWECYTPIPVQGLDAQKLADPKFLASLNRGVTGFLPYDNCLVHEFWRLSTHSW